MESLDRMPKGFQCVCTNMKISDEKRLDEQRNTIKVAVQEGGPLP